MIETTNDFLIGGNVVAISPVLPVIITSQEQAMRTAAWILTMGELLPWEGEPVTFDAVLAAIENT
jgi:hypothetical protein